MPFFLCLLIFPLIGFWIMIGCIIDDESEKAVVSGLTSLLMVIVILFGNHQISEIEDLKENCLSTQIMKIDTPERGLHEITICTERKKEVTECL